MRVFLQPRHSDNQSRDTAVHWRLTRAVTLLLLIGASLWCCIVNGEYAIICRYSLLVAGKTRNRCCDA